MGEHTQEPEELTREEDLKPKTASTTFSGPLRDRELRNDAEKPLPERQLEKSQNMQSQKPREENAEERSVRLFCRNHHNRL